MHELERVAENNLLPPIDLEVLLHVLTYHFDLAIKSLAELMNDQVPIVATEVVWNNTWILKLTGRSRLHWRWVAPINKPVMLSWSLTFRQYASPSINSLRHM